MENLAQMNGVVKILSFEERIREIEHSLVEIERAPSLDWIRPFQEPYPKQGAQYVKAIVGPPSGQE